MAGALGFALAGPRSYGGKLIDDAWMGTGRSDLGAADIRRALRLVRTAHVIGAFLILLVALVTQLFF
jgi:adenosylcobinamide-phosphate synthase